MDRLALKEKFEYQIKRSSKTHSEASCKDICYKFQLHAVEMQWGSYWIIAKFILDHSCELELFRHYLWKVPAKVISSIIIPGLQDNDCIIRPRDVVGEMQTNHGIQILYSQVLRAKKYPQNLVYGDPLHSFQLLSFYYYMLERENPRTAIKL